MNQDGIVKVERALVSTTNSDGLQDFCSRLNQSSQTIFTATDTAARLISEQGLSVVLSGVVTGLPPGFLGGLVKTLHPNIHGGILGAGPEHADELAQHAIRAFDMVVVNFYDFMAAIGKDPSLASAKKATDIGGPCMARAAAKNWESVVVVVDPADYPRVIQDIQQFGGVSRALRYWLAVKAFDTTTHLDAAITAYMMLEAPDKPERIQLAPLAIGAGRKVQLEEGLLDPTSLRPLGCATAAQFEAEAP